MPYLHVCEASTSSNFQPIFDNALKAYKKRTKNDLQLLTHPLADRLKDCDSASSILTVLQEQVQELNRSQRSNTRWLEPTVNVLHAFSDKLGEGVGSRLSSAKVVFIGFGILLSTAKDVRADQESLFELFERIETFFRRLDIYTEVAPNQGMVDKITTIMAVVLDILAIATEGITQGRMKKYLNKLNKLIRNNGIEDVLKRLDRLTQEEARMASAQLVESAKGIDSEVREIVDSVSVVDDRVARVEERVASVDECVDGVDKRVVGVDDGVPTLNTSDLSGSEHFRVLLGAALKGYKQQTGIDLAEHPLFKRIKVCNTVESVTAILCEQAQDFKEFREKDKVLKPLKKVLTVLHILSFHIPSSAVNFAQDVGLYLPPVTAIQTALGILLSAVSGVIDDYSALADLLESIGHFLNRLEIYAEIPRTKAMDEIVVKILVEVLSTLALTTKEIRRGKLKKLVWKLAGEKEMEAMVQRLDRLTHDEARQTVAHILKVVHGLVENMKVVMDDGKVSVEHLKDTLEIMHGVASDLNKAKRDRLQKDIFEWLSPPDPWKNHHTAYESRHHRTAEWFIQGNTFSEWRTSEIPGSLLWVHGKPGAGKSVLCSTIIEDIRVMQKAGLVSLAFFYCDFREDQKKELRGLLSSFLVQFCHQSDSYFDILSKFYSEHDNGLRRPNDDALAGCLKDLLKLPGLAPVYLIVDGLDECPNPSVVRSPRTKVLSLIEELVKIQILNLWVCVTSRPEADIKDVLDPLIFHSVSLHDESGQRRDIEDYIKSVINTRTTKRWKEEHRKLVIDVLTEKSNGMFRWADCQMVHICDCIPARIPHALAELPETLDETYERTLRKINKANWEFAHRMFQFVSVASRPLHVQELAELLAIDFEAGSIPKLYKDWRLEDPADAVLSTCSTLLAVVNDWRGSSIIQFSHFSVKEFLTSTRLAEASDDILRRHHVSMTPAHTLVTQACLGVLLDLDKDITSDDLQDFPLAKYAAKHWVDHARFEDVSQNVKDGMKQLFDPSKPHLAISLWIHDPFSPRQGIGRNERPPSLSRTSLHYAASWGVHSVVEFLIIERSQDVCSRYAENNETPLHLASRYGHVKAACKLIEHGADLTAQINDGSTPLHLASEWGQVDVARMLIRRGADLTAQINDGSTPLHRASQSGQVDVARMLIEHGADLTARDYVGSTPLHRASRRGQVDVGRMLIERGADLTAQINDGSTPLHLASQWGQVNVARMLIERGADMAAQISNGWTPLHLASQEGEVDVARMLIEHGADLTARIYDGSTPLHLASEWGRVDIARMLIERGADVTEQINDGSTPLHFATQRGNVDVAHMLMERGADLTARYNVRWTPVHRVSQRGQVDVGRMLIERAADLTVQINDGSTLLHLASQEGEVDVGRMFVERGADLTAQIDDGSTPLHLASEWGQEDVARMVIERGVDMTAHINNGWTPLHLASQEGEVDVARMLIERGADLTAQINDGSTPLHLATQWGKLDVARMLIEHGTDLTARDNLGWTPLHRASQSGQVDVARMLIERGADLTAQNNYGWTPLHLTSYQGQVDVARMLIKCGADATTQNNNGETPLHLALQWGQVDFARMLINKRDADLTAQNNYGSTPLHLALQKGQVDIVRMLIERGTDVTAQNNNGETPLYLALQWGQLDVARMLIERGADLTAQTNCGSTPLHLALQKGEVDIARMLVERGADAIAQNNNGETPLHLALQMGQVEIIRMLIERGADLSAQNRAGQTPLHLALKMGQADIARMLIERGTDLTAQNRAGQTPLHLALQMGQADVARVLIERGADLTAQNNYGWTQLHLASRMGQVDVARMLIEHGTDLRALNNYGYRSTPLHVALQWGQVDIALMLIEHDADLTAQNRAGQTPLHLASQWGQVDVARMLIERGADLVARNKDWQTPLHLASRMGQVDVARMLTERGADLTARDWAGQTPLHLALQKGKVDVARMLIECGADLTAQNNGGKTPLHLALQEGQVDIAHMLVEHGADLTAHNRDGQTSLHLASAPSQQAQVSPQKYAEVAHMLLEHGADVNVRNKNGLTPFDLALQGGLAEIKHVLVQHGVDSGACDNAN